MSLPVLLAFFALVLATFGGIFVADRWTKLIACGVACLALIHLLIGVR